MRLGGDDPARSGGQRPGREVRAALHGHADDARPLDRLADPANDLDAAFVGAIEVDQHQGRWFKLQCPKRGSCIGDRAEHTDAVAGQTADLTLRTSRASTDDEHADVFDHHSPRPVHRHAAGAS